MSECLFCTSETTTSDKHTLSVDTNCCDTVVVLISALKFDVGGSTDAGEASAVGYKDYYIDVYSNSWGPNDFGFIVEGPGSLVQNTLATGVTEVNRWWLFMACEPTSVSLSTQQNIPLN